MSKTDGVFLKHFLQIIALLAVITVALIVYAHIINERFYNDPNKGMGDERAKVERDRALASIAPIGGVYAGATGLAAKAAADAAALEELKKNVPYGGREDGAEIYGGLCKACHDTGAGGSPLLLKSAWTARVAQGEETLIKHAIEGYKGGAGVMPARGGNPALTDAQVSVSVRWMVAQLK
jgi:cytochrome c5